MQYMILSTLAFLGAFCGLAVGKMAEEELEPGREYLKWLMHLIFIAILAIFLFLNQSLVFLLAIPALIIIFSFSKRYETLWYYTLAAVMFISYKYNGFIIICPLIFLYGFPMGSIHLSYSMGKNVKALVADMLLRYGGFLALGIAFSVLQ